MSSWPHDAASARRTTAPTRYLRHMTTKADFTEEDWARLMRAPLVAGMAISLADPGGPIEAIKESSAAIRTVLEAAETGSHGAFVQAVAADVAEKTKHRQSPLGGFKPKGKQAGEEILEELRAVNGLLVEKTTPEEADQLMRTCRMLSPDERPHFPTLLDRLTEMTARLKSNILRVPPYYNTT